MGRLAAGTKIRATKPMGGQSNNPHKASSIEVKKSEHKLANLQIPIKRSGNVNQGVTAGAMGKIEHFK